MKSVNNSSNNYKYQNELLSALYNEIIVQDAYGFKAFYRYNNREVKYIIDIGANIGMFTLVSSILYPSAQKILIEPSANNIELIKDNLNGFDNIKIYPKALGNGNNYSIKKDERWSGSDIYQQDIDGLIQSIKLSDIISDNRMFTENYIIKCDCEGGEVNLLSESIELFKNCICFMCEFHEGTNTCNVNVFDEWFMSAFDSTVYTTSKESKGTDAVTKSNLYLYKAFKRR